MPALHWEFWEVLSLKLKNIAVRNIVKLMAHRIYILKQISHYMPYYLHWTLL